MKIKKSRLIVLVAILITVLLIVFKLAGNKRQ